MTAIHRVVFRTPEGEEVVDVPEDEYLLTAAWEAGLGLPSTCLRGWCTTCAGRMVEGEVDQSDALRYFPEDEEEGWVLLCSARPRSDLVVETHCKEEMREHRRQEGLPAPRG